MALHGASRAQTAADFYGVATPESALGRLAGGFQLFGVQDSVRRPPAATPTERAALFGSIAFADSTIGLLVLLLVVLYFGGRLLNR